MNSQLHWEFFDRFGAPVVSEPGPLMRTAEELEETHAMKQVFRLAEFDLNDPAQRENYSRTMNNCYSGWWTLVAKREFIRPMVHYVEWLEKYMVPRRQAHLGAPLLDPGNSFNG